MELKRRRELKKFNRKFHQKKNYKMSNRTLYLKCKKNSDRFINSEF